MINALFIAAVAGFSFGFGLYLERRAGRRRAALHERYAMPTVREIGGPLAIELHGQRMLMRLAQVQVGIDGAAEAQFVSLSTWLRDRKARR